MGKRRRHPDNSKLYHYTKLPHWRRRLTPKFRPSIMLVRHLQRDFASESRPDCVFFASFLLIAEFASMLNKSECKEFRKLLLATRNRLRGDVEQLRDEALDRGHGQGESRSPTHIAELGTDTYEQDFALRVAENDQEALEEIEAALKRLDEGTFGLCEACLADGKSAAKSSIPKTRLRAIPYVRNCVSCEAKRERLSL